MLKPSSRPKCWDPCSMKEVIWNVIAIITKSKWDIMFRTKNHSFKSDYTGCYCTNGLRYVFGGVDKTTEVYERAAIGRLIECANAIIADRFGDPMPMLTILKATLEIDEAAAVRNVEQLIQDYVQQRTLI
jgi:hypothetical protein